MEGAAIPAAVDSVRSDATVGAGSMTMDGQVMGTPMFMPPEQALGKLAEIDERSDIYALGAILYNILTLRPPVDGDSVYAILMNVVNGQIAPPTSFNNVKGGGWKVEGGSGAIQEPSAINHQPSTLHHLPHLPGGRVPAALSAVAMKALSREKADRYQTAKELQKDIEAYQGGFATSAEEAGLARQLLLLVNRHKGFVAAAALVLLAVTAGLVVSLAQWRKAVAARTVAEENAILAKANERKAVEARNEAQEQRDAAETAKAAERKLREQAEYDAYVGRLAMITQRITDCAFDQAEKLLDLCPEKYRHWEWRRLKFLSQPSALTLRPPGGRMNHTVCFSPTGQLIATGGQDKIVSVWRSDTGELWKTLKGHTGTVNSVRFFSDSSRLVSGSYDKTVRIWNMDTGECVRILEGHTDGVKAIAFSRDGSRLASAGDDGHAMVWDVATGARLLDWSPGEKTELWSVALSPSGKRIAVCGQWMDAACRSREPNIWIVDTGQGSVLQKMKENSGLCTAVAWSSDESAIVTGGYGNVLTLWEASSGRLLKTFERGHTDAIYSVAFSPDAKSLLTASRDMTARIWSVESGKELRSFAGHSDFVKEASWSPTGDRVATASPDGTVRCWDLQGTGKSIAIAKTNYNLSCFSPDGRVVCSMGKGPGLWDARTGKQVGMCERPKHQTSIGFSPDGAALVTGDSDGIVRIWRLPSLTLLKELKGHTNVVNSVTFSPDGSRILSAAKDKTARLWCVEDGTELWNLPCEIATGAVFSPDGGRIVMKNPKQALAFYDIASRKEVQTVPMSSRGPFVCCYAPDGKSMLVPRGAAFARVDVVTGGTLVEFKGHKGFVNGACFSPGGLRVATSGEDKTARVWDANTGRELLTLRGHEGMVRSVDWSPDGTSILTSSDDQARIWLSE